MPLVFSSRDAPLGHGIRLGLAGAGHQVGDMRFQRRQAAIVVAIGMRDHNHAQSRQADACRSQGFLNALQAAFQAGVDQHRAIARAHQVTVRGDTHDREYIRVDRFHEDLPFTDSSRLLPQPAR
jgi:hypothetical protein